MNPLKIGTTLPDAKPFNLPLDLVTQTIAILARKGKGKSYLAAVIAEELMDAAQVPIIIDPTGAHWGLKSSADGKREGYKVVVFGGDHADLPLDETAGEIVARAIVEHRFAAILDLSLLRKGASHRFLALFLETLYRLNRTALHLICDEADDYAPQRPFGDEARVLGAMEDIVRRGRVKGIGCTLVTQRPQVINKNVLTQAEMLVTLNMGHPKDIDAIQEWIAVHGDEEIATKMIKSLPSLDRGTAWFWAPGWGDLFELVKIRARRTFNSGATPKAGETVVTPKQVATVDVALLGKEIAETAQRAKDNAPETLKARIRDLEKQLAAKPVAARPVEVRVEVPVICKADMEMLDEIRVRIHSARESIDGMNGQMTRIASDVERILKTAKIAPPTNLAARGAAKPFAVRSAQVPPRPALAPASGIKLGKAERAILTCLAQFGPSAKAKVAAIAGYSPNGGGFNNSLGSLRTQGLVTVGEPLDITDGGREALGEFTPLPTGDALIQYWLAKLGKAERLILETLAKCYPDYLTKEDLATSCGYEASGGGFNNALGSLRTQELITRGALIRANENLFA